ncbi:hypothetical protein DERP_011678 [Dermatophagoides pteronyssinus]|uniref:Uncharacterized protein n=1 Tax=Dermatophagoides pteronyssinus TaxID=6956 RepID=A0ABQ8J3D0_DERPT|nr:hypothetical protein DERP_011678 [Dermatophagoides pteronyssinus]
MKTKQGRKNANVMLKHEKYYLPMDNGHHHHYYPNRTNKQNSELIEFMENPPEYAASKICH